MRRTLHLFLCIFMLGTMKCHGMLTAESIKKTLNDYCIEDQELRKKALRLQATSSRAEIFKELGIDQINARHSEYLKEVINHYGWPKISEFGQEACQHAWILVQHCNDTEFQKDCLTKMEALDKTEVDSKLIAYLYDRIQINSNLLQRYGTQINEKGEVLPLENPECIDELRASVGLEPLQEYLKLCKERMLRFAFVAQAFDAIINLGGDCQAAYQLYIHGLRKYALPFDTLVTPYDALREMLKNNFESFMRPDNFELVVNERDEKYILDKKYGTRLLHDFKLQEDFLKDYEEIAEKYLRRIDRLIDLIITSEYPLFIRKKITQEQAAELKNLLFALREGRPFLLVVLDGAQEIESDWKLEGVYNYYLRQLQPYSWKGDPEAWKEIFYALGLEVSNAQASSDER